MFLDEKENPVGQLHGPVRGFLEIAILVPDSHLLVFPDRIGRSRKFERKSYHIHLVQLLPDRIQERTRIPARAGNQHQDLRRGRIRRFRKVIMDLDGAVGKRFVGIVLDNPAPGIEKRCGQALQSHQEAAGKEEAETFHERGITLLR